MTRVAACVAGLACLGGLVFLFLPSRAPQSAEDIQEQEAQLVARTRSATPQHGRPAHQAAASQVRGPWVRPVPQNFPKPLPALSKLVNSLAALDTSGGALTEEQVAAWKEKLRQLLQQGDDGVAAIHEFLDTNTDFDFGSAGKEALGYASAREAMFDALAQMGSSLSIAALGEVLQNTADPREIASLAQILEKAEPGRHQQEAVDAARQTLAMAAQGKLKDKDMAPLFEVFREYGGVSAAAELERTAAQWNFYAMMAMAQLPEGAGVQSLIQFASGPEGALSASRAAALELLAQVASQSPEARAALVDQARQNKISQYNWASLIYILAGDQMVFQNTAFDNGLAAVNPSDLRKAHIATGNQNFFMAPLGAMTVEQIGRQQALVEELLNVTADPEGIKALEKAKVVLAKRLPQVASTVGKVPSPQ